MIGRRQSADCFFKKSRSEEDFYKKNNIIYKLFSFYTLQIKFFVILYTYRLFQKGKTQ